MTRASAQLPASPAPASRSPSTPQTSRVTALLCASAHPCSRSSGSLSLPACFEMSVPVPLSPGTLAGRMAFSRMLCSLPPQRILSLHPGQLSGGTRPRLPGLLKATLTHGRFRIAGGAPSPAQSQGQRKQNVSLQCPANSSGLFCKDASPTGPSSGCASCHPQALLPPAFLLLLSPPCPRGGPHTHLPPPTRRGKTAVSPSLGFSHPGCDGS